MYLQNSWKSDENSKIGKTCPIPQIKGPTFRKVLSFFDVVKTSTGNYLGQPVAIKVGKHLRAAERVTLLRFLFGMRPY